MNNNSDRQKSFAKLGTLKNNPIAKPLISKLIQEQGVSPTMNSHRSNKGAPSDALVREISDRATYNINDASNIFQLLPDTELLMQILISSILSPKDMVNVELDYITTGNDLPGEVCGPLIEIVRSFFDETYNIKKLLPKILEECLFTKGSAPYLILPESSIDNIINGDQRVSIESLGDELNEASEIKHSIGLLGSGDESKSNAWSLESLNAGPRIVPEDKCGIIFDGEISASLKGTIKVSDNINALKYPLMIDKMCKDRVADTMGLKGFGFESNSEDLSDNDIKRSLYKRKNRGINHFISVKTNEEVNKLTGEGNNGHPLVIKLPPECIIPVHVPSDPSSHIGYFVLLDQYGNPLHRARETDYYKDLNSNMSNNGDLTSQLLEAGKRVSTGMTGSSSTLSSLEKVQVYSDIVEDDLLKRLKNGVYGESIEISKPLDVFRIMLGRSLSNMDTQILYVPAELITYMAFDYNENGVGKSLLENNKILGNIRAMLLFSNTMASIKNSVGKTALKIDLDPKDPDPAMTVEYMVHEYSKNKQTAYPLGASSPLDIIDFLGKAGVDIQVSGNAAYPETRLEVEDYNSNKTLIDTDLEESIRKKWFMSFGVSPETIDAGSEVEFATSIVSSNLLLAKRVLIHQDILLNHMKDFIIKFIYNSAILMEKLMDSINLNKKSLGPDMKDGKSIHILEMFFNSFEVTLPRPDSAKLETQITAFDAYKEALESAVDAYFSEDIFSLSDFDDIEENISTVRAAVISYFQREWLRNNNVLPELMDLVLCDEEGLPELDMSKVHGGHLEQIGKSVLSLLTKLRKDKKKRSVVIDRLENDEDEGESDGEDVDEGDTPEPDDVEEEGESDPSEEEGEDDIPDDFDGTDTDLEY